MRSLSTTSPLKDGADRDARLLIDVVTVIPRFTGEFDASALDVIEHAIPKSRDSLPQLTTRYVALGFTVADVSNYPHGFDGERIMALSGWLDCHGAQLLTIQVADAEIWTSTGPMYSFDSYAGYEYLPRAVVIPGPHPFWTCDCAACTAKRPLERAPIGDGEPHGEAGHYGDHSGSRP